MSSTSTVIDAPHRHNVEDLAASLSSDIERGLTAEEASLRLGRSGPNIITERGQPGPLFILLGQFRDTTILVLLGAAVISGLIGDLKDAVTISVVVLLNSMIAFVQELRARRAISALKKIGAAKATVIRGSERHIIAAETLVPGDVVVLEAGAIVPADIRLSSTAQLRMSEALLTGESVAVEKNPAVLSSNALALGDRSNMAFKGTTVAAGRGIGIVTATGMQTELGRLARMMDVIGEAPTPLQQRLNTFGRWLSVIVIGVCIVIFLAGLARGEPLSLMFITAVSLAVAAIPEALPATLTIALALGARIMAEKHGLIRHLAAVEALGSVTFVCADKTGTLTQDRMEVEEVLAPDGTSFGSMPSAAGEPWRELFTALALNNDVSEQKNGLVGDPTEIATYRAAANAGFERAVLERQMPRVFELPFEPERKCMTTIHARDGAFAGYTKGAPEALVALCSSMLGPEGERPIAAQEVLDLAHALAARGLRVLAVAKRDWAALPTGESSEAIESDLVLLGLVGLIDPPRPEAEDAVAACQAAGIVPVMITGDHPQTAQAIAQRLGIADRRSETVTGAELAQMPDTELAQRIDHIRVFARVDPAQKIRIVEALQARGEFVAMTGDGVNDAPALQRADIGIAMGRTGTDVAREASDLVLLDDNFATIVAAVREGRRIYDNIRKFLRFMLTGNSAEIWTMFLAPFAGLPMPLLPIQILWVNLVTDSLPALALAAEPVDKDAMRRPPRPPSQSILGGGLWQHTIWVGLLIAGASLLAQAIAIHLAWPNWQTMVFTVLTFAQMGHVLAVRSERQSMASLGVLSNRWLIGAVVLVVALQLLLIYAEPLNSIFNTAPLTTTELAVCIALSLLAPLAVEIEKALRRRSG